jgi:hypothetical protein
VRAAELEKTRWRTVTLKKEIETIKRGRKNGSLGKTRSFAEKRRVARTHYFGDAELQSMKISASASEIKIRLFPDEPPAASGLEDWIRHWRKALKGSPYGAKSGGVNRYENE